MHEMSLNQCMHPRNIYKNNPPDFIQLSELYPEFKQFVKLGKSGQAVVNFRNPDVVRTLTKCLLHRDFRLTVALPNDRLAPTVPSRLNYLLWIQDLFNATTCGSSSKRIIDIGTGSSCIYPLLGVKTDPEWRFTATEIDEKNLENALHNVRANSLEDRIQVVSVPPGCRTLLKHLLDVNTDKYDCCMCNPPFFTDFDESCQKIDRPVPNSSCHAGFVEAIAKGGDLAFATKLLQESLELKERLTWFTIMFGKKKSFIALKNEILKYGEKVPLWTSYEFCQGNTVRWAIAWTFCPQLVDKSKLPMSQLKLALKCSKSYKPIKVTLANSCSLASACGRVKSIFGQLGISFSEVPEYDDSVLEFHASAKKATWIHVRLRARKRKTDENSSVPVVSAESNPSEIEPPLDFAITLGYDAAGNTSMEFKPSSPNQKEILNGLVVYLKRLMCK